MSGARLSRFVTYLLMVAHSFISSILGLAQTSAPERCVAVHGGRPAGEGQGRGRDAPPHPATGRTTGRLPRHSAAE